MKKIVRQHNDFVASPYAVEFTSHEIKLIEYMISDSKNIDKQYMDNKMHKEFIFSATKLSQILNTHISRVVKDAHKLADSITSKKIVEKLLDEDGNLVEFTYIPIISFANYNKGTFKFAFNYYILRYFVDINKNFTEYQLYYLLSMSSTFAIKLYKLLYQYKNIKLRTFTVQELKEQFGVSAKYLFYGNFKQKVLDPAVIQINLSTDLQVSYNEIKIGRKINKIEFIFKIKSNKLDFESDISYTELKLLPKNKVAETMLVKHEIDDNELDSILQTIFNKISPTTKQILNTFYKDKGEQYILASIEYAEENAKTNFDKYLQDTLKNGWCIAKFNKIQQKAEQETKNIQLEQQKQAKQEEQVIQRNIKQAKIKEDFLNLPIEERTESFSELITQISKAAPDKINEIVTNQEEYTIAYWSIKNKISYNGKLQLSLKAWLQLF